MNHHPASYLQRLLVGLCALGAVATLHAQRCTPAIFSADTLFIPYSPGAVDVCLADGRDLSAFDVTLDGTPVAPGADADCGTTADPGEPYYYDFSGVPGGGLSGAIHLHEWEVGNDLFGFQDFTDARDLAAYMLRIDPGGRWRYEDATQRIVSDLTTGEYSALFIRWEPTATDYDLPLLPADAPGTSVTLPSPATTYLVDVDARDGSCAERLVIVRRGDAGPQPPSSTERFTVPQDGDTGTLCVSTDDVPSPTSTTVCETAANGSVRTQGIGCFAYRPIAGFSGTDRACLLTCNDAGLCDTTFLEFTVSPTSVDCATFEVDGPSRLRLDDCDATATFRLRRTDAGTDPVTFTADGNAVAATESAGIYSLELPADTRSVGASNGPGCDQRFAVDVVCDDGGSGTCDLPFDETLLGQGIRCSGGLQDIFLPATPEQLRAFEIVVDGSPYLGPREERIDPRDGLPATVLALPPTDEVLRTIVLERNADCSHTVEIATRCVTPARDTLQLLIDQPRTYCLSSDELFQRLSTPSLLSANPADLAQLTPSEGGCITANAMRAGSADVVLVACTRIGICDTTYLHLSVSGSVSSPLPSPDEQPRASDDRFVVDAGLSIDGDLLANDVFGTSMTAISLLDDYRYGTGALSTTGMLTYTSSGDLCGVIDSAAYQVCGRSGCDTAIASVRLRCDTLLIFGGFSPNGDGLNDHFVIDGLDDYPGARLIVFNRWGNAVMERVDYANDWAGTYDGSKLPDGTYFYLLELPGRADPVTGSVSIYR